MHLILIGALTLVMFASVITISAQSEIDRPQAAADAAIQVDQYRMFMYVADQYMKTSPPTGPGIVTVTWATMASSPVTPPGAKLLAMPATWRVVRAADSSWVSCTEMNERSVGSLNQLLTAGVIADPASPIPVADLLNTSVQLSSPSAQTISFVILGSPATATSLASLCNS